MTQNNLGELKNFSKLEPNLRELSHVPIELKFDEFSMSTVNVRANGFMQLSAWPREYE